jgi:hypothetical protein
MITTIHIVENSNGELEIVDSSRLKGGEPVRKKIISYTIRKRYFDEDGELSYYDDIVDIKHTFKVITSGEFILNDNDSSNLNAYNMSSGLGQISKLAYAYSATILMIVGRTNKLWNSDVVYTESGIKETRFDMYSYHVNEPKQIYLEDRLSYEVYDSLDFTKILSKYLNMSFIRNSKIDDILK